MTNYRTPFMEPAVTACEACTWDDSGTKLLSRCPTCHYAETGHHYCPVAGMWKNRIICSKTGCTNCFWTNGIQAELQGILDEIEEKEVPASERQQFIGIRVDDTLRDHGLKARNERWSR